MADAKENIEKLKKAVSKRASSPSPPITTLIRRRGPPPSEALSAAIAVDEAILKRIEAKIGTVPPEILELKELIDKLQKDCGLKNLPKPLGIAIPETLSPENYGRYITETPIYLIAYDQLIGNKERFTEEERKDSMMDCFAYIYNGRTIKPESDESFEDFCCHCASQTNDTLIRWREKADAKGVSLEAYINRHF